MRSRILLFAAVVLLAALPLLAEENPSVDQDQLTIETGQVEVARDEIAPPSEASPAACDATEMMPSTGPFEELLAAASASAAGCGATTPCSRPFNPIWNAYCNNWCLSMGYYGGACGSNRCCLCIAEG